VGGINFGIIISKYVFKKDVRGMGSGNAGATNMLRSFGKLSALAVFFGDMAKGAAVILLSRRLTVDKNGVCDWSVVLGAGLFVILGHIFPVYFRFRGGKGVATALGVLLAVEPLGALVLLALFIVIVAVTRYISLGSVASAALIPAVMYLTLFLRGEPALYKTAFGAAVAAILIFTHRQNIVRLKNRTENKISFGKKA